MKKATVADLRNHFSELSHLINNGEKITITKRGRPFAILSPVPKRKSARLEWPDRSAWRKRLFPQGPQPSTLDLDRGHT